MKFLALKEIPNGIPPGVVFDATEAEGDILIRVGAAKRVDEEPAPVPRRRYVRRDLEAQD